MIEKWIEEIMHEIGGDRRDAERLIILAVERSLDNGTELKIEIRKLSLNDLFFARSKETKLCCKDEKRKKSFCVESIFKQLCLVNCLFP